MRMFEFNRAGSTAGTRPEKTVDHPRLSVSRALIPLALGALLGLALETGAAASEDPLAVAGDANSYAVSQAQDVAPFASTPSTADNLEIGDQRTARQLWEDQPAAESSELEKAPYVLARGDTINVKFYKYTDISGEFLVRSDGTISVPLLGTILIAGKNVAEAEATLEVALAALTNKRAYVSVEVSKYRPVYVVGFVEHAGSFSWVPDLNVLQAVSLAGGFPRVSDTVAADSDREMGELTEAAELLGRALVRRERLLAERDVSATLQAPKQLAELVSELKAKEIIDIEQRLLQRNIEVRKAHKENLKRTLTLAEEEVNALTQRLEAVKSQIEIQGEMAQNLRGLLKKGNTTLRNVSDVESEVARLESERGQLLADLAQAKQRLNTSKYDVDKVDSEVTQEVEQQLADLERDIAKHATDMSTSKTVLKRYGAQTCPSGTRGAEPNVTYEIVRKSASKLETITVDETALVQPGDTLKVRNLELPCSKRS